MDDVEPFGWPADVEKTLGPFPTPEDIDWAVDEADR